MAEEKKTAKPAAKKTAPKKEAAPKKAAPKKEAAPQVEAAPQAEEVKEVKAAPKKAAPKKEAKPAKAEKASKKEPKKEEKPAKPKPTQATAFARDVRIAPRKVRLVADLVRGKSVKDALGILAICNRVAKGPVEKAIRSAAANATNNFGMDADSLYVAEIQVGEGLKIKRFIPRGKGSASPIIKRNAHIRVAVKEKK